MNTLLRLGLAACLLAVQAAAWAQATGGPAAPGAAGPLPPPRAQRLAQDPALEAQVMRIAGELRCLVCQNETIAASQADLAVDLRQQVREQLRAGRTEAQIRDYMVARYGDFVLYTPPVKPATYLLWLGPFVLLGVVAGVLVRALARRRTAPPEAPLSEAQRARAEALLGAAGAGASRGGGRP